MSALNGTRARWIWIVVLALAFWLASPGDGAAYVPPAQPYDPGEPDPPGDGGGDPDEFATIPNQSDPKQVVERSSRRNPERSSLMGENAAIRDDAWWLPLLRLWIRLH